MIAIGTRAFIGRLSKEHPAASFRQSAITRDVGMSKLVTSIATFSAGSGRIIGANGDFAAFTPGDPILIRGSNLNDGERIVITLDAVNQAFMGLDAPPKDEGPVSVVVRTI
jgi:hypothetical protein